MRELARYHLEGVIGYGWAMMNILAFVRLFLLPAGVAVTVVLLGRRQRRRQREAHEVRLAAQWERLLRDQEAHRARGARLLQAVNVYQLAHRGSKAVVRWCETGEEQDAWFEGWHVPPGAYVLVTGDVGYGPHNGIVNVLYVNYGDVFGWTPAAAPHAWRARRWPS